MLAASLFSDVRRVLCVGAHPDDIEIGCGGSVLALLEANRDVDVRWLVLTGSEERHAEARRSAELYLGKSSSLDTHEYPDGFLPYHEPIGVKQALTATRYHFEPEIVFAPSPQDAHQDHRFLGELMWQVFRNSVILHYEIVKYEGDLGDANVYVPLTAEQAATKLDRLFDAFPSQHDKPWFHRDTFAGLMRLRGVEAGAGVEYAEAFEAPKLVVG